MTYTPTAWVNYGPPCVDDAHLNNMENGIDRAQGDIMVLYGPTAALPASDPLLVGRLYYESDLLRRIWRDNGAGWDIVSGWPAPLLETGQTTCYAIGDDGDVEAGVDKLYAVLDAGAYAGTSNIEVASYAGNQISFTAPNTVADVANGLAHILTGDTVVIKGSVSNDGIYTVAGGGVAGSFTTAQPVLNEVAGRYVKLYKRAAHSNNCVQDTSTGLMWSRNTSNGERVGAASNGLLNWYDVAARFTIYSGVNTISVIMPGNIFRITGGAALPQFHVGDLIMCAGFATPVNNLPMMYVISATPNGADLDVVVAPGNQILIGEGAVGDAIYLNCRSVYNYAAGARLAGLALYTDWRVPNIDEAESLYNHEVPNVLPNAVAFPGWPATWTWTSTTAPDNTANALRADYLDAVGGPGVKTQTNVASLVRG